MQICKIGGAASLVARIKNTKTPFSIDFGVGDVIVPNQEKRKIPTQLDDFAAPTVNTYSLETTIAEKIDTKTDDYSTVLRTIKDFLAKPILAAVHTTCFDEQWIAATNTWGQGGKYDG